MPEANVSKLRQTVSNDLLVLIDSISALLERRLVVQRRWGWRCSPASWHWHLVNIKDGANIPDCVSWPVRVPFSNVFLQEKGHTKNFKFLTLGQSLILIKLLF